MNTLRSIALTCTGASLALLAGCQKAAEPLAEVSASVAAEESSAPDAKLGISISGGRLVMPAVAGRPAVAYFEVSNSASSAATLASVYITGTGTAEMHRTEGGSMTPVKTLDVPAGQTVAFAPGGNHVMVFELADTLKAGGTTEMTLTFADGDKISVPLKIEAMGGMEGMHH